MQALYKFIPENYFVKNLKDNTLGSIKLALLREVKGNMIIRSNYPDETITFKATEDKDVVEVPARKLKSREKLMGLKICREFEVVDEQVRYNVIKKSTQLANPNSILFGDSVTESGDAVGLTSRAIYDWAYSLRDVSEITATLQHNALSEGGTMHNEDTGKLRQSLFQVQYVKPATFFPHFITVENVTPELFIHLLACVLFENHYGAQSTTQSANVQNHLVGIGFNLFEAPLNSFSLSQSWNGQDVNFANVQAAMREAMQAAYGKDNYRDGEELSTWIKTLWQKPDELKAHYEKAQKDCEAFLKAIKVTK